MSVAGVQGYKKVGISAALNTGQSILEICGSIIVLVLVKDSALKRLTSLGLVSLAAAALSAIVGMSLAAVAVVRFSRRLTGSVPLLGEDHVCKAVATRQVAQQS